MSMRINIEKILQSPESIFKDILQKLTERDIKDAKDELKFKYPEIDTVLFDAIKLILSDLKNEENYINRLLYRIFKIEVRRNIRREQLIILGSQLKAQQKDIKRDMYRVKIYIDNISSTLKNLERLRTAFKDKSMFLVDEDLKDKSIYYIGRIEYKIRELKNYKKSLEESLNSLQLKEKKYSSLLKQIPRYYEINEEIYLQNYLTR